MKKAKQIIFTSLAIVFMVMSVVPDACGRVNKTCDAQSCVQAAEEEHEQDHDNNCSPFCVCICNLNGFTVIYISSLFFPPPLVVYAFSVFKQEFVSSFFASVWQPPKIS